MNLIKQLTAERVGWFGAGLGAAAVGVVGDQLLLASLMDGQLPGPQPLATPTLTQAPTATRTPRPSATPYPIPTRTPTRRPTSTSTRASSATPTATQPDVLATLTLSDPEGLVAAVATFAARTNAALGSLPVTPGPR